MADTSRDKDTIEDATEEFKLCEEAWSDNAIAWEEDVRFARLEEQWPADIRKQREQEGRPCHTINRLGEVIRQVVNDARQNKPSITVHPADDQADPETAEIFNGLIRNVEVVSKADVAYDTSIEHAVSGGFGFFRIGLDYACDDTFEQDVQIKRIANALSVLPDPDSVAADSSDWNIAFVLESLPKKTFERKYKGAEKVDWSLGDYAFMDTIWRQDEQVVVAERWVREESQRQVVALVTEAGETLVVDADDLKANPETFAGCQVAGDRMVRSHKVTQYIMTGAEVLEKNDWKGRFIPIIPVYGDEVNLKGKRHFRSLIRSAKDSQRRYNYHATTVDELIALAPKAPFIGEEGAFDKDPNWLTANTVSHPYLEYKAGKPAPQRQPFAGVPSGEMQATLAAAEDIRTTTGIHQAGLGQPSNETSGRAIMARQREGDVSTFHFSDNQVRAIRHAGLVMIDLIPHVYSQQRVARTIGVDGKSQLVPLKTPVPVKDANGQPQTDPNTGQPITRIYDLTVGKYDLTVKSGPSFTTRREEAANQMVELIRAYPQAAPLIGDLLAKNLDWPEADEIAKRLKAMLPPQLQGQNPELEQAKQQLVALHQALTQAQQAAEAAKNDNSADGARIKLDAEKLDVDRYNAETARLRAIAPKGLTVPEDEIAQVVMKIIGQLMTSPDISPDDAESPAAEAAEPSAAPAMPPGPPMGLQPPESSPAPPIAPPHDPEAFAQALEGQEG